MKKERKRKEGKESLHFYFVYLQHFIQNKSKLIMQYTARTLNYCCYIYCIYYCCYIYCGYIHIFTHLAATRYQSIRVCEYNCGWQYYSDWVHQSISSIALFNIINNFTKTKGDEIVSVWDNRKHVHIVYRNLRRILLLHFANTKFIMA